MSIAAVRDRALLLLGFAGAFRRSELVALDVADIEETAEGLRVKIRGSKTDQERAGATIAIVRGSVACPVAAVKEWLVATGISEGAIFRRVNKGGNVLPGRSSMIHIQLDDDGAEYELREFRTDRGLTNVINPADVVSGDDIDWSAVAPPWAREHGTAIVLLGSDSAPDSVLGDPKGGEDDIKGLSVYLNTRFWDLQALDVTVVELRSERKTSWPASQDDRDDARRPNNRKIMGAKYYLTDVSSRSTNGSKLGGQCKSPQTGSPRADALRRAGSSCRRASLQISPVSAILIEDAKASGLCPARHRARWIARSPGSAPAKSSTK